MDFRGRSSTPRTPAQPTAAPAASSQSTAPVASLFDGHQLDKLTEKKPARKLFRIGGIALLFSLTGLVIALTFLLALGGNGQAAAINKDSYQAVFLNNGQVYFGNLKSIGKESYDLQNIYYLQTNGSGTNANQAVSSSDVSLIKLGCELHAPTDRMLINSSQVLFWENIKDDGQVVKAINDYKKQNAGATCAKTSASTQQSSSNSAESTTPTPTSTATPTPTPTPTTKKP